MGGGSGGYPLALPTATIARYGAGPSSAPGCWPPPEPARGR
jgi:hypothetical protein